MANWARLTPEQFELLCAELIEAQGYNNVQWFQGGNDRGRDIVAELRQSGFANTEVRTERWIFECKHWSKPIGVKDFERSVAWAVAHGPDVLAVVTSGHLTNATRDWVADVNQRKRYPFRIHYYERSDLEGLVHRHPTPTSTLLSAVHERHDPTAEMSTLLLSEPEAVHLRDYARLAEMLDASCRGEKELIERHSLLCLAETHRFDYDDKGTSRTRHTMTLMNIGPASVDHDFFRFYGELPVHDNTHLKLTSVGLKKGDGAGLEFTYDLGTEKKARLIFSKPLPPAEIADVEFAYTWPYPGALTGPRYYVAESLRYRALLGVEATIPAGFSFGMSVLLRQERGLTTHESGLQLARLDDDTEAIGFQREGVPSWRQYVLTFGVIRRKPE